MLRIFEALKFATIENIKIKDGQIKRMEVKISIDFDDPESFKKAIDELGTIAL